MWLSWQYFAQCRKDNYVMQSCASRLSQVPILWESSEYYMYTDNIRAKISNFNMFAVVTPSPTYIKVCFKLISWWSLCTKFHENSLNIVEVTTQEITYDHISPTLNDLYWLSVRTRIILKLLIMACMCNQGVAPQYLLTTYCSILHTSQKSLIILN